MFQKRKTCLSGSWVSVMLQTLPIRDKIPLTASAYFKKMDDYFILNDM